MRRLRLAAPSRSPQPEPSSWAERTSVEPDVGSWLLAVRAGVLTTFGVVFAASFYLLLTWDEPNRSLHVALWAFAALAAVVVWILPTERIIASRHRNAFFLAWSALDIALIAMICILDDGVRSPFALLLFLTLAFAALFYPRPLVVLVGAMNVVAFVAIGVLHGEPDRAFLWFFSACLAGTAYMCAWQASNHDRRRAELMHASRSDPLTGLLNRRGFQERLDGELDRAERAGLPFGLVLLDLDCFKQVNDERGHAAGDAVLVQVARRLEAAVRPMDAIGRLGGDEFAVLLAGAGRAELDEMRDRIRAAVCEQASCSVGAAGFPANGADADEMLSHADAELYAGKRQLSLGSKDLSWATALAEAADARLTRGHSQETALLSAAIAERLGWHESEISLLRIAAMLHDIGKVALSERVLQKPEPLTPEERAEVEQHPAIGAALVARIDGMQAVVPWIRHSHEHFDGSGYPDGLAGEAIPPASRIMLVADAFDVMRSDRPYRRARGLEDALAELQACSGTQFDPVCVEALVGIVAAQPPAVSRAASEE
jgi:diguanylate cyclase (GGDEF)-like protein/putative nucleotidyltransferase with HDIG domain